jgi:hypothetical protein
MPGNHANSRLHGVPIAWHAALNGLGILRCDILNWRTAEWLAAIRWAAAHRGEYFVQLYCCMGCCRQYKLLCCNVYIVGCGRWCCTLQHSLLSALTCTLQHYMVPCCVAVRSSISSAALLNTCCSHLHEYCEPTPRHQS